MGYLEKSLSRRTANPVASFTDHPRAKAARGVASPLEWAMQVRRIDDQPFTLDRFPPLVELYGDDHPHIVVIKPAQRGVSEWAITRALHALDIGARFWNLPKNGLNVGYLFPTQQALGDFSKERISDLKNETDYLSKLFESEYQAVTFKQIGASYLYLRGAWSKSALKSFPADFLILDEYDEMDPRAIALARKRMNASLLAHEIDISTPTLPGRGIHAEYLRSDQRIWETQCGACGEFRGLDFFRDVRAGGQAWEVWREWTKQAVQDTRMSVCCPNCRAEIDRCGPGRWRAKEPQSTVVRGYHVPWWPFPFVSLNKLAMNAISTDPSEVEEFYRSDLGLPYEAAGSRITEEMMRALSNDLPNGKIPDAMLWSKTTMGVDVGAVFNVRISSTGADGQRYVRFMATVKSWDDLSDLIKRYNVRMCIVDGMPELHGSKTFAAKHKRKVLRAFYPQANALTGKLFAQPGAAETKQKKMLRKRKPAEADDSDTIQINRTMAMDVAYNTVAEGRERWPVGCLTSEIIEQMKAPIRVTTTDARGEPVATWEHTSPDHYFHACVYDLIALRVLPKPIGAGVAGAGAKGWTP